jgi:hypothetical protein
MERLVISQTAVIALLIAVLLLAGCGPTLKMLLL